MSLAKAGALEWVLGPEIARVGGRIVGLPVVSLESKNINDEPRDQEKT